MYCKNCGKEILDKAVVCIHCGVETKTGNKYCPNCGEAHDPLAIYCVKCGHSFIKRNDSFANSANKFEEAILTCLKKFATFEGRANRTEYWSWWIFSLVLSLVTFIPIIGWLIGIVFLIPSLAVGARRLHDTGRSGLLLLIGLIPILGAIALLILFCQPSEEGDNAYGANPN